MQQKDLKRGLNAVLLVDRKCQVPQLEQSMQTKCVPAVSLQTDVWVTFGPFPVSDFIEPFFPLSCLIRGHMWHVHTEQTLALKNLDRAQHNLTELLEKLTVVLVFLT